MENMKILGTALLLLGMIAAVSEMHTLTIYLLVLAVACFAGGAAALFGAGLPTTLLVIAVVLLLGMPAAHWWRRVLKNRASEEVTHDDVGNEVEVIASAADGLRVSYRGAGWQARLRDRGAPLPAPGRTLRIVAREGNVLVLD